MKIKTPLIAGLALVLLLPLSAGAKSKKKHADRGILESMQSVPCGVKQGGLNGVGSFWGSIGIEHMNSNEKLCQQYLLRTDEVDYHIRPLDAKHAPLLPVGQEGEFKVKKDRLFLKVPDVDKKARAYQVVAMEPVNSESQVQSSSYRHMERPTDSRSTDSNLMDRQNRTAEQIQARPPR